MAMNQEKNNVIKAQNMGLFLTEDLANNQKMLMSLRLFRRVLKMDPHDKGAHLSFAKALMAVGDDVAAEDHLIKCVEIDPCYLPGLRDYAQFLEESGRAALAESFRTRCRDVLAANIQTAFNIPKKVEPEPYKPIKDLLEQADDVVLEDVALTEAIVKDSLAFVEGAMDYL
jgi:hypothetical protein